MDKLPEKEVVEKKFSFVKSLLSIEQIIFFGFFIGFIIWIIYKFTGVNLRKPALTKENLRKRYGVNKATFQKWVKYFCCNDSFDFDTYQKMRKLSPETYNYILDTLGEPTEDMPVRSKGELAHIDVEEDMPGNYYRSFRESVFLTNIISEEAFKNLNKFPPKIAHQLYSHFC